MHPHLRELSIDEAREQICRKLLICTCQHALLHWKEEKLDITPVKWLIQEAATGSHLMFHWRTKVQCLCQRAGQPMAHQRPCGIQLRPLPGQHLLRAHLQGYFSGQPLVMRVPSEGGAPCDCKRHLLPGWLLGARSSLPSIYTTLSKSAALRSVALVTRRLLRLLRDAARGYA